MMDQAKGQTMGMMPMIDHGFMMRVMRFTPRNVAAHADDLDLDETQRAQLQEVHSSMQQRGQMMQRGRGWDALREAFDRDVVDLDVIWAAVDSLSVGRDARPAFHDGRKSVGIAHARTA